MCTGGVHVDLDCHSMDGACESHNMSLHVFVSCGTYKMHALSSTRAFNCSRILTYHSCSCVFRELVCQMCCVQVPAWIGTFQRNNTRHKSPKVGPRLTKRVKDDTNSLRRDPMLLGQFPELSKIYTQYMLYHNPAPCCFALGQLWPGDLQRTIYLIKDIT